MTTQPIGPAPLASALLGSVIAMVIAGLVGRFNELFSTHTTSTASVNGLVIGASLVTLAIGVRVPQRMAVWVCTSIWRRLVSRGKPADMSDVLLGSVGADRPMYWVVLSVIALAAGLLTALLPLSVRLSGLFYEWMHVHFIWSLGPLALLEAAIVFLAGLVPLTILGLAVSCVHHLSCPYGRWDTKATAWLLIGAAGGTLIALGIARATPRSTVTLIAAALPVLLLSLVAVVSSSLRSVGNEAETELIPLPDWSDRRPRLVRTGIAVAGGAAACAMSVWVAHLAVSAGRSGAFVAAMLLAVGIGGLSGSARTRIAPRSIRGFGIACLAAAAILVLGPIELIGVTLERHGDFAVAIVVHLVLACSGLAAIGVAAARGQQALLSRVASRSSAGATVLARALVCAALTVWIGAPIAQRLVGESATLLLPALAMLTIGAMLIIREPFRQAGTDIEQSK